MDPAQVKGLIVALISPKEPALEAEMNRWLDEVHCADVAETPGVIAWTRYTNVDPQPGQPRYMTVNELDREDAGAARDDLRRNMAKKREQGRVKSVVNAFHLGFYRRIFQQVPEPATPEGMVLVMTNCLDAAREREYNDWYNTRHMPAILTTPGMTGGMRFKSLASDFTPADYLQMFFIGSPDVAGVRAAMGKTLAGFPEPVRSSAGMAKPVLVATFQRLGPRHAARR